ncbi:hypothetical protein [Polycladidibacter stylochi]|uniref:hypothetical protein n=1 Tax=Polycladidibacter stylochi TaxID=1807766 RepID=UPI000B30F238|nr:hypothetical protein [Pseudovibrio stylochi]
MAYEYIDKQKKQTKPDLDKLYGPLGIQAIAAANRFCAKTKDTKKPVIDPMYPLPTD